MTFYINEKERHASTKLGTLLIDCIDTHRKDWDEIVFLCIGSDRITGDSLGPLIGHQLSKCRLKNSHVYGTLAEPVHALNLNSTIDMVANKHSSALVIAIDASLGSKKHLGFITIGNGSIAPGAGVHKKLPPVGDIFITGIVNITGTFEHFLLQTTRLSTIVSMADSITGGILLAYHEYFGQFGPALLNYKQWKEAHLLNWSTAASTNEP